MRSLFLLTRADGLLLLTKAQGKSQSEVRIRIVRLELADELQRCLAGLSDLAEDVLGVNSSPFTGLAKINIAADSTLVANADDWESQAAVADNSLVNHVSLLLFGPVGH